MFGSFSPLNGHQFVLELPQCNSINFQIYLDEFAKEYPDELKILVLDNGAFHKAKRLKIPDNIEMIFLPPYSPELNPAEKIWQKFKRDFTNKLFHTLEDLRDYVCKLTIELTEREVVSICSYDYIFLSDFWTNV